MLYSSQSCHVSMGELSILQDEAVVVETAEEYVGETPVEPTTMDQPMTARKYVKPVPGN